MSGGESVETAEPVETKGETPKKPDETRPRAVFWNKYHGLVQT